MAYSCNINTDATYSLESDLSILESKLSVYHKTQGNNIGTPATRLEIRAATTENIINFLIALILIPFTDLEMAHINLGDKTLSIIADRSEINDYFSRVIDLNKSSCGLLGREIVLKHTAQTASA